MERSVLRADFGADGAEEFYLKQVLKHFPDGSLGQSKRSREKFRISAAKISTFKQLHGTKYAIGSQNLDSKYFAGKILQNKDLDLGSRELWIQKFYPSLAKIFYPNELDGLDPALAFVKSCFQGTYRQNVQKYRLIACYLPPACSTLGGHL